MESLAFDVGTIGERSWWYVRRREFSQEEVCAWHLSSRISSEESVSTGDAFRRRLTCTVRISTRRCSRVIHLELWRMVGVLILRSCASGGGRSSGCFIEDLKIVCEVAGVTTIRGRGVLVGANTIRVTARDEAGVTTESELTVKQVILATGSSPRVPEWKTDRGRVLTNRGVFQLESQ